VSPRCYSVRQGWLSPERVIRDSSCGAVRAGDRDRIMLTVLYNTGGGVGERKALLPSVPVSCLPDTRVSGMTLRQPLAAAR